MVLAELSKLPEILDIDQATFSLSQDIKTPKSTIPWLRTININMSKETGETYSYTQLIPEIRYSDFNPNFNSTYEEVL